MYLKLFSAKGLTRLLSTASTGFLITFTPLPPANGADTPADAGTRIVRHNLRLDRDGIFWKGLCVESLSAAVPSPLYRQILLRLSATPDTIVSREDLRASIAQAGPYIYRLNNSILNVRVCQIRQGFRDIDPNFSAIETVAQHGLRWHDPLAADDERWPAIGQALRLEPDLGRLYGNGRFVKIEGSQARALELLIRAPPSLRTYGDLIGAMRRADPPRGKISFEDLRNVHVQICRLKSLLRIVAPELLVLTVHGTGYQIIDASVHPARSFANNDASGSCS